MPTTFDLPAILRAQVASFGLLKSAVQFRSPFNGTLQAMDLSAERWACSLTTLPNLPASAGAAEALINQLAGGSNRVRIYHPFRPYPVGTLRGSPTLNSSAAIGASALSLADADNGNLLVHTSSFDRAIWSKTNVTVTANVTLTPAGTTGGDQISDTSATGQHAVDQLATVGAATGLISGSCYLRSSRGWAYLQLIESSGQLARAFFNLSGAGAVGATSTGTNWSGLTATIARDPSGMYLCTVSATKTNAATSVYLQAGNADANNVASYAGNPVHYLEAWGAKLERGTPTAYGPQTLLAGDMVGVGSQLLQVSENCTADDSGFMTVPLVNRVRAAIASGSAVVWNKPTAEFVCPSLINRSVFRPGYMEGAVLDLEEAF